MQSSYIKMLEVYFGSITARSNSIEAYFGSNNARLLATEAYFVSNQPRSICERPTFGLKSSQIKRHELPNFLSNKAR